MSVQFRRLYRVFLFRVVDLELLSAGGDVTRLVGQLAVLPVLLGAGFAFGGLGLRERYPAVLESAWALEHALIATTMLLTGLFTVLSWEATFPDLRDAMVLGPLPVRTRELFFGKLAALCALQALVPAALNALPSLAWTLALAPPSQNLVDLVLMPQLYRTFAAFWLTMFGASAFVFLSVLALQGMLAHLLPRGAMLRISSWLQLAAFCLFLSAYFLQPVPATAVALADEVNGQFLAWLPAYWFLGLFQQLNGSMHAVMQPLAVRADAGPALVTALALLFNLPGYRRRLRELVEQPEVVPYPRRGRPIRLYGFGLSTAILQFFVRSLTRSRQHRLLLGFYLGAGLSTIILLIRSGAGRDLLSSLQQTRTAFGSAIVVAAWVLGVRMLVGLPVSLKANWVFRLTQIGRPIDYHAATRRTLLLVSVTPVALLAPIVFLPLWPWQDAFGHVLLLVLWAVMLAHASVIRLRKLPFTCAYQAGKSHVHLRLLALLGGVLLLGKAAEFEQRAIRDGRMPMLAGAMAGGVCLARELARRNGGGDVEFDDEPEEAAAGLGLSRDGFLG
ncbi:MAG: hypothetical protein SFV54_18935 [Bryobacteraceae bacterium]|nr:hypothetical protein [Bryobacteraceae bacterium]